MFPFLFTDGREKGEIKREVDKTEDKEDDDDKHKKEIKEIFKMEGEDKAEDDEEDEDVLWCSGCTCTGCGPCSQCKKSRTGSDNNDKSEEIESESGLPIQKDGTSGGTSGGGEDCCPCPCPCPFPRSQSLGFENIPMTALSGSSRGPVEGGGGGGGATYLCATSGTLGRTRQISNRRRGIRRHPLIPSKTIVVPPTSSSSLENLVCLENKANSIACLHDARIICREKILQNVPNKMSSTGVRIFYLCGPDPPGEDGDTNGDTENKTGTNKKL